MTVRDIYVSVEDYQKIMILKSDTNRSIWDGLGDSIPIEYLDYWVKKISCSGHTLIIFV